MSSNGADDATSSPAATNHRSPPRIHSAPPPHRRPSPSSFREDCWSDDSTHALIEAWGSRHVSLNRGHLRHHHWQSVAAAVNSAAGSNHRRRWSDVQCKNRIDTLKKKYKIEKSKTDDAAYVSAWPFFSRLDYFISGGSPAMFPTKFPVGRRSATVRRPANEVCRRKFLEVVAALSERERETESASTSSGGRRREREEEEEGDGFGRLAEAIRKLGEVYERVEGMKQEQMIELEKHRMQFAKDLEFQRMKLLMDTQLQLAGINKSTL